MADFCQQCSEEIFGEDFGDLLPNEGEVATRVRICEGCGPTHVNLRGKCIDPNCLKKHGTLQP